MRKHTTRILALFLVLLLLVGGSVIAYADGPWDHSPNLTGAQALAFGTEISGSLNRQKTNHYGDLYYYTVYELQPPENGYYRFRSTGGHWSEDDNFYLYVDMFDASEVHIFEPCSHGSAAVSGDFLFSFYLEKDKTYYMLIFAARPGNFTIYGEPFDPSVNLKSDSITLGYKQVLNIKQLLEGTGYTADDWGSFSLTGVLESYYSRFSSSHKIYGKTCGTGTIELTMKDSSFTTIEVTVTYSAWQWFCYYFLFGWIRMYV